MYPYNKLLTRLLWSVLLAPFMRVVANCLPFSCLSPSVFYKSFVLLFNFRHPRYFKPTTSRRKSLYCMYVHLCLYLSIFNGYPDLTPLEPQTPPYTNLKSICPQKGFPLVKALRPPTARAFGTYEPSNRHDPPMLLIQAIYFPLRIRALFCSERVFRLVTGCS